jgi:hypothetical protein
MLRQFLTTGECVLVTGVSRARIFEALRSGELKSVKLRVVAAVSAFAILANGWALPSHCRVSHERRRQRNQARRSELGRGLAWWPASMRSIGNAAAKCSTQITRDEYPIVGDRTFSAAGSRCSFRTSGETSRGSRRMTEPKFVFRNGKVVSRAKLAPKPQPVDNHKLIIAAIHNLAARVSSCETQIALLTNPAPAAKSTRSRKTLTPKSA